MPWTPPATWTTGQLITAATANSEWRDNLNWLGTSHDHSGDAGDGGTVTRTVWVFPNLIPAPGTFGTEGRYPVAKMGSGTESTAFFSFAVPSGFGTVIKAVVLVSCSNTLGTFQRDVTSHYGGSGEALTQNSPAMVGSLSLPASATWYEDNVALLFTGTIAGGDYVGVQYIRRGTASDTLNGTVNVLGLYIVWG